MDKIQNRDQNRHSKIYFKVTLEKIGDNRKNTPYDTIDEGNVLSMVFKYIKTKGV